MQAFGADEFGGVLLQGTVRTRRVSFLSEV
jgi:hypothetical protein